MSAAKTSEQYLIWPDETVVAESDYCENEYQFLGDDYVTVRAKSEDEALATFNEGGLHKDVYT